jgi:hypothetical protein
MSIISGHLIPPNVSVPQKPMGFLMFPIEMNLIIHTYIIIYNYIRMPNTLDDLRFNNS